jgi:hypothetical protein
MTASTPAIKTSGNFPFFLRNSPGANGYDVIHAQSLEERERIWRFVYQNYQEQGYAEPNPAGLWYSLHDALPQVVPFLNPHHTFFYERLLLFERVGETRSYGKVNGAPAILLRLDMDEAPRRYREKYGDDPGGLYAFLTHPVEHAMIRRLLRGKRPRLPLEALHRYFAAKRGEIEGTLGDVWDSLCYA